MACFELYQLFGTIITRLLISRSGYRRANLSSNAHNVPSKRSLLRRQNNESQDVVLQPDDRRWIPLLALFSFSCFSTQLHFVGISSLKNFLLAALKEIPPVSPFLLFLFFPFFFRLHPFKLIPEETDVRVRDLSFVSHESTTSVYSLRDCPCGKKKKRSVTMFLKTLKITRIIRSIFKVLEIVFATYAEPVRQRWESRNIDHTTPTVSTFLGEYRLVRFVRAALIFP